MTAFISWYILITVLGWLTFPLAYFLFPALADRGYTLARSLGLLLWGYIFWLFASLQIAQNNIGGLLLGLVVVGGLSAWAFLKCRFELLDWLRENRKLILTTEVLFVLAFGLMAFVRSTNPDIVGTEKPMELMFISGIMRSPTFPPRDLWLSGYSISYYHFGYVMTSMLALFTGIPATMAFNLMIALIFGLSAAGAYGILYNLLARRNVEVGDRELGIGDESETEETESESENRESGSDPRKSSIVHRPSSIFNALLAPLFLLIVSNAEGFLHVLHSKGLFWQFNANGSATSRFWSWLDIPDLRDAPAQPLRWVPDHYWWWWRASRVVQDYEFNHTWREVIDEFPFFSYLLSDLHPHVLAMPFDLLALAVALNLFFGGWRGKIDLYFGELRISKAGFFTIAVVLGGLAFLNTWDILIAGALIVFSYALARVHESGWGWERLEDVLLLGVPLVVIAFVMYLPFYIGFDSQAGGIVPNFMFVTRGAQTWVMWFTLFVPLFAYLIYLWRRGTPGNWRASLSTALGIVIVLFLAMFAIGFLAWKLKPDLVMSILQLQGMTAEAFIRASLERRWLYIGGLLTLLALLVPALAFLFRSQNSSSAFVLLMIALGALLIIGPDFLYLRDNFGWRINTVFKFYYQAWIVLSLAAAYAVATLVKQIKAWALVFPSVFLIFGTLALPNIGPSISTLFQGSALPSLWAPLNALLHAPLLHILGWLAALGVLASIFFLNRPSAKNIAVVLGLFVVMLVALPYPTYGLPNKTNNFKPSSGYTLDDFQRVQRENPDEAAAIQWLRSAPDGVEAEAVGGAYSAYARISIYTGLPTVLGWGNHEGQWRDQALQGSREADIQTLYMTNDWNTAQTIISRYQIRYIYVGNLERSTYRVNEEKFSRFLKPVFQQGSVTIYEVP